MDSFLREESIDSPCFFDNKDTESSQLTCSPEFQNKCLQEPTPVRTQSQCSSLLSKYKSNPSINSHGMSTKGSIKNAGESFSTSKLSVFKLDSELQRLWKTENSKLWLENFFKVNLDLELKNRKESSENSIKNLEHKLNNIEFNVTSQIEQFQKQFETLENEVKTNFKELNAYINQTNTCLQKMREDQLKLSLALKANGENVKKSLDSQKENYASNEQFNEFTRKLEQDIKQLIVEGTNTVSSDIEKKIKIAEQQIGEKMACFEKNVKDLNADIAAKNKAEKKQEQESNFRGLPNFDFPTPKNQYLYKINDQNQSKILNLSGCSYNVQIADSSKLTNRKQNNDNFHGDQNNVNLTLPKSISNNKILQFSNKNVSSLNTLNITRSEFFPKNYQKNFNQNGCDTDFFSNNFFPVPHLNKNLEVVEKELVKGLVLKLINCS
ncbi:hypothetical protein HK099_004095 [Clydaea vesicula]|uniref:Uncharacterized protein n=1 Tax=Clydaea vesicula TaxID=447962 RepID=A0AAD5U418_9FUNG|nr:hypothetical protein HK099_004095 [Clydaea vesicula]